MDYAELHCHSFYSFADGADSPADLVEQAIQLGLKGLAITDHDGLYGVAQFAEAARNTGRDSAAAESTQRQELAGQSSTAGGFQPRQAAIPTIFGAELNLNMSQPRRGQVDPLGTHLVVLARNAAGYRALSRAITEAHTVNRDKELPVYDLEKLATEAAGQWQILTGCRKGPLSSALEAGENIAQQQLHQLMDLFGRDNVAVELTCHDLPDDFDRIEALVRIADRAKVAYVATNNVHYASPQRAKVANTLAATRARSSLEDIANWLPTAAAAHLRSGQEMAQRFGDYPRAVETSVAIAQRCAFDLKLLEPQLPIFEVPEGYDEFSHLAELTLTGARQRYGPPENERPRGAWKQLNKELQLIKELQFPGYFLIVADLVRFCRDNNIFCQGRGSAANSAVCYALGITNVDAIEYNLLFERFLSSDRDGPPDIDLDIESGRREEVIQYAYEKYGRTRAAMVANVITYRPRSAVRDAAKALGYSHEQATRWSKQLQHFHAATPAFPDAPKALDPDDSSHLPAEVRQLAAQLLRLPQHLGVHPGGMVICKTPVSEIVPVEWARATDRTVLQWDKEDCASAGLVKFDLLGLGMLEALHRVCDLVADHHGVTVELAKLPSKDDEVFAMLQAADTVGVFQVESRAQMSTLPRLKPQNFYDLVIEVALIRPGPVQGGSVHPYLRRRNGEKWKHKVHRRLWPALEKTLGVPIFQEQLMQIAIDAAGFSGSDADQLRRAMGAKRSTERMEALKQRLYAGMAERGISTEEADQIYRQLAAFADFGFPESHAASFAHLVWASAWFKCHYPAAFCAALLASQPMGFYSPASLIADVKRHGVGVRAADVNYSRVAASLEATDEKPIPPVKATAAIRLGLDNVASLHRESAERIAANRPYRDIPDLARRARLSSSQLEALALAGALGSLQPDRRRALWTAGMVREDELMMASTGPTSAAPTLPGMSEAELAGADYAGLGFSLRCHPMELVRSDLPEVLTVSGVHDAVRKAPQRQDQREPAATQVSDQIGRIQVAGVITHRQRPPTAGGVTFLSIEDETGILNVVCSQGLWKRWKQEALSAKALLVRGTVEHAEGAVSLMADKLTPLRLPAPTASARDFK
ncbi:error-prone DNA polymerase [Natronoglycomyces albus]|uniref:Error-prone DNA polymerase n=1 Tax=Natronoglycomyces albus TaxID=2811108 RepID=A0A895XV35_9ACTN|nr:error-prone DNA polymerase [Natronoglycomyces albus]QSB06090.1 error-prone DNA polymerase [Natronoglycomyces albus]